MDAFGGFLETYSNVFNPMSLVPVYASIRIISQSISTAKLELYEKTQNGRVLKSDEQMIKEWLQKNKVTKIEPLSKKDL